MIERNKEKYYLEALGSLVFVIKQLGEFTVILVVSFISVLLPQRKRGPLKLLWIANRCRDFQIEPNVHFIPFLAYEFG